MPDLPGMLDLALRAGIRLFQYREKRGCDSVLLQALYRQTQSAGALLIVNDAAELIEFADGLHVGQSDLEILAFEDLRHRYPTKIIGVSVHTAEQARAVERADYVGVGPVHDTRSKQVPRAALGISGVSEIARATSLPVCAIGGIVYEDIPAIRNARIAMAAVIGAVANATEPYTAALNLVTAWNSH